MTQSDLNPNTNMPRRVRLGDILGAIEMTPGEVSTFLAYLADRFMDGPHQNMARAFRDHAALVASPTTYGYKTPEADAATVEEPYTAPTAPDYARPYAGDAATRETLYPGMQTAPAAQGQSTTPATEATPLVTPSQNEPTLAPKLPDVTPDKTNDPDDWQARARAAGWNPGNAETVYPSNPPASDAGVTPEPRQSQDAPPLGSV